MLTIIIYTIVLTSIPFTAFNTFAIFHMKVNEYTSYGTKNRINELENKVEETQPLVNKYKKEQKQKHLRQYNDWKRSYENKHGRCAQCHCDDLEIKIRYKLNFQVDWFREPFKEYPESAEYKCNTCGEVISTWEFKEDE